ncbi:MAG: anthranilate synthase component I family protein [Nocardioides sp.]|jgi:anthranilate/para-aminobenzoate synthase component I
MSGSSDPVEFFADVAARHRRCFWLDGGGAREWSGRRSLIGWLDEFDVSLTYDARRGTVSRHSVGSSVEVGTDVFAVLEEELAAGAESDQWFGYFGYAARPDLPASVGSPMPDAIWMRARNVRLFDHEPAPSHPAQSRRLEQGAAEEPAPSARSRRLEQGAAEEPAPSARLRSLEQGSSENPARSARLRGDDLPPRSYADAFARVQDHLLAGNSYEVNLTYRLEQDSPLTPVEAYLRLRELNPAPYAGFLQHDLPGARGWLLSSSPERYALVTEDRTLETKPIKGTTPRAADPDEDERQRKELATHPKFRAENLMIVDLLRNDLSMVCEAGTVEVPVLMEVESYQSVHQLVSTVRGRLRDDVSTPAALRALFPAGSMTGAPKLRTMEIIEEVEDGPRGPYAGAFGWVSGNGCADLGVVIRSLTTTGDGRYTLGTGGGITVQSDASEEYAESRWKAERLLRALEVLDVS